MMTDEQRIAAAELKVEQARERLVDTVQSLAEQLEPHRLARELWENAKDKGADLAEEAVDAVKARPLAATGIAAGIALFLAREPIADFAGKMWRGKTKAAAGARQRKPAKSRAAKAAPEPKTENSQ
jgi:ElaB/YqjD/DUF883 family membrane-anchored ribosome-binding protein